MTVQLRSHRWFKGATETGLLHRGALRSAGIHMDDYHGQPIIGIANTWSELNNCNMSLKAVALKVKEGIQQAGGIALEFPVISLGEELMKPTAGLYRNLLSIEIEEHVRSYPLDGLVLLGNCDKTVPGLLMGAISADIPTVQLNAGPKIPGIHNGQRLGSGTDLWKYGDQLRAGVIEENEWEEIGKALSCGFGSCNTMGTASTMNAILEALGMMPLGLSSMPVDSELRFQYSVAAGKRIVEMVKEDLKPSSILTINAFKNAIAMCMALGGSTNAIIHLTALAGRRNLKIYPHLFNEIGAQVPCIVNVQPAGEFLIQEFDYAGGVPSVIRNLGDHFDLDAVNYTGVTFRNQLTTQAEINSKVIKPLESPVTETPTIIVLKGNLAEGGAVLKAAAASHTLTEHRGKAVVFDGYLDMLNRIDADDLDVDKDSVLVLRNAGPKAVPGMPEWGMIPIPKKLYAQGVRDMVRISDARMSGTSFGTVVLHIVPEAVLGSNLALVKNGDIIELSVSNCELKLRVSEEELANRRISWQAPKIQHTRGYPSLFIKEVLQADEGCDFDFLQPKSDDDLKLIEPIVGRS